MANAPWSHVHTASAPSVPDWQIQRSADGVVDFYHRGRFVPADRVPSDVREELAIALALVTPMPVGDLSWDERPGRPAEPTRVYRVGAPKGPPKGPALAPTGRPWLTDDERQRLADRIRRGQ